MRFCMPGRGIEKDPVNGVVYYVRTGASGAVTA